VKKISLPGSYFSLKKTLKRALAEAEKTALQTLERQEASEEMALHQNSKVP
jgi:hypothetical protein